MAFNASAVKAEVKKAVELLEELLTEVEPFEPAKFKSASQAVLRVLAIVDEFVS